MKNSNLILKLYAMTLTFIAGFFLTTGFKANNTEKKFDEITVQRINIVEPDGKLKMVISNAKRQHPGMFDGKIIAERQREPGIIFFNEEQDEVGGLAYSGNKKNGAGMVVSFDQYKNDQVMQMQYLRNPGGEQQYGMNIWDRPEAVTLPKMISTMDSLKKKGVSDQKIMETLTAMNNGNPLAAQRFFAGKNFDEQVGVFIKDKSGNNRINIYLDKNNEPKFQILDEKGKVVKEFINK